MVENDVPGERTAQFMLDLATSRGFEITRTQLARWHRAGVLPAPRQRSRGRGRGTETVYPPGTGQLLLAVCEARKHRRKLDEVAWALWWAGNDVPSEPVRAFLAKCATKIDNVTSGKTRLPSQDTMRRVRLSGPLSGVRKRMGRDEFPELVSTLLGTLSDHQQPSDSTILVKALGLQRARKDRTIDAGPLISSDVSGTFQELGSMFGGIKLVEVLSGMSDHDLKNSRDAFKAVVETLQHAQEQFTKLWGPDAFGLASISKWVDQPTPQGQALVVILWHVLTAKPSFATGRDKILETKANVEAAERNFDVLESFRAEFPNSAGILAPQQLGAAFKNKRKRDQLQADLRKFRKANRKRVDEFFERPEIKRSRTKQ